MNEEMLLKLLGGGGSMIEAFKKIGKKFGDCESLVTKLFNLLPKEIQSLKIIDDKLADRILYNFGDPIKINGNDFHCFGESQNFDVENLYLAISAAYKYLDHEKLANYIYKIKNKDKHADYIFEMRPLLCLKKGIRASNECNENCNGNKNVDWLFEDKKWTMLVEVKNRIKSTVELLFHVNNVTEQHKFRDTTHIKKFKAPNPADLFKDVIAKFKDKKGDNWLQGCWISTGVMEDEENLNKCFEEMDANKIQFVIISSWNKEAYILVKDAAYKSILLSNFGLVESKNFVRNYQHH